MNVSAANAGIGLGAIVGGVTIPLWGTASVGYVAAGIALLAVATVPMIARLQRRAIKRPVLPDDHPDTARGLAG
jgi:DHA1 family inner membrane transport protein